MCKGETATVTVLFDLVLSDAPWLRNCFAGSVGRRLECESGERRRVDAFARSGSQRICIGSKGAFLRTVELTGLRIQTEREQTSVRT